MQNNKTLCLYLATSIVAFLFSGIYIYLEDCYYDESFAMLTGIEQQLYVKYCTNPLSFNPFDNYYSKLEYYILYICWIVGSWNFMDFFLGLGVMQDKNINPNCDLKRKSLYNKSYNKFITKIKEKRKLWQKQKRKLNQKQL